MSRALITLHGLADRQRAIRAIQSCPAGARVEIKAAKRTIPQNDRMWAMLTDIAQQVAWHGKKLTTEAWKLVFLDGLKRELQIVPNLDGTGFVNIGRSSSDLSKEEMGDLMELMAAFGAQHGVVFHDDGLLRQGPVRLTMEEIEAARSPRGGWTASTLAAWGVPWPPPKGWQEKLLAGEPVREAA